MVNRRNSISSNAGNIHVKRPHPKRSDAGNIHVKRPKVTRARIDEKPESPNNCNVTRAGFDEKPESSSNANVTRARLDENDNNTIGEALDENKTFQNRNVVKRLNASAHSIKRQRVQTTPKRSNAGNIHVKRPHPKRSDAGNIHVKRPKVTRAMIDEKQESPNNCNVQRYKGSKEQRGNGSKQQTEK